MDPGALFFAGGIIGGGIISIARWKLRNLPEVNPESEDALDFLSNNARYRLGNRDNAHPDKEHTWLLGFYRNWDTGFNVGNVMGVRANEP